MSEIKRENFGRGGKGTCLEVGGGLWSCAISLEEDLGDDSKIKS